MRHALTPRRGRRALCAAAAALALVGVPALVSGASAAPETTAAPQQVAVQSGPGASQGPHEVVTAQVSSADVAGAFGGGTVYYPADGSQRYGAIAAAPGFFENQSAVAWYGDLLASHGFVVLTLNTNLPFDFPDQRATMLLAALDYLAEGSVAADRVDASRQGVMGHSMGGGGSLAAASARPAIKAAVPLTPWHMTSDWSRVSAATLVIGGSSDFIAPAGMHAEPFYEGLTGARAKAYLKMNGGHFITNRPNDVIAQQVVAWFKRFLNEDTSAGSVLCPPPSTGGGIVEYRDTCPHT
jgi:pimeloyl-ACP methyl ester carboxylesterase